MLVGVFNHFLSGCDTCFMVLLLPDMIVHPDFIQIAWPPLSYQQPKGQKGPWVQGEGGLPAATPQ